MHGEHIIVQLDARAGLIVGQDHTKTRGLPSSAPLRKSLCQSSLKVRIQDCVFFRTQIRSRAVSPVTTSLGSVPFSQSLCFVERPVLPQLKGSFWSPAEAETLEILSAVPVSSTINSRRWHLGRAAGRYASEVWIH